MKPIVTSKDVTIVMSRRGPIRVLRGSRSRWIRLLPATLALALTIACGRSAEAEVRSGETIVRWNENSFALLTTLDNGSPAGLALIRELAMVHIAMHDAANGAGSKYKRYVLTTTDPEADPALSAAAAAHATAVMLRPGKSAQADVFLQTDLDRVTDMETRQRSLALGAAAADAILKLRAGDGFSKQVPYTFGAAAPGAYQPTAAASANVVGTQLPFVTPFGLTAANQFRAPPPPALSSAEWLANYNEVKNVGRFDSAVRTADQTHAALFWREQTQFVWNRIARVVAARMDKGLWQTARIFALLNMGLMDGLIANFDTKYQYNYWRPYTAIREADDGRSDTVMDPDWQPLNPTPGHPEHNSAQTVLGAAAAFPLTRVYGADVGFTISTTTSDPPYSTRTYTNFDHAVTESSNSRVWAGIHFRSALDAQARGQGKAVGGYLFDNFLVGE